MDVVFWVLAHLGFTPDEGVTLVGKSAKEIEQDGLYAIIAVLVLVVGVLFALLLKYVNDNKNQLADERREKKELHGLIISMVERQTIALTEANMNSRKIEIHLERLSTLQHRERERS